MFKNNIETTKVSLIINGKLLGHQDMDREGAA